MASKHLSLLSLFLVISTLQVHARDSQFFSKVIPNNNNNNNNLVDEAKDTQLTPQREEDLPRFTQESRNGYGLYGHDEIQNPQFNEVPNGASSSSNLPVGDEFAAGREKFEQGMSDTRFLEHGRYYYNAKNDNLTPNREFGSGSSDREVEYSRNQYYNGGFNNGNNNNNKNINDDDFDP
ncbi:hypothetical protein Scep_028218 [Stephania cephalantha]|uniref:Uncharacterized protein n=1 Tax=Stephania cephalantha TaxID=152367 RepID=A0AAP0E9I5_9MAGN